MLLTMAFECLHLLRGHHLLKHPPPLAARDKLGKELSHLSNQINRDVQVHSENACEMSVSVFDGLLEFVNFQNSMKSQTRRMHLVRRR